jgi:hypothetical protein
MSNSSPFPGLDPWLEEFWDDVHTRFMVYAADQIHEQLPADLIVRVEVGPESDSDETSRATRPDRIVVEQLAKPDSALLSVIPRSTAGTATVDESVSVALTDEPAVERRVDVFDTPADRIVTVIKLVSPANKSSEERRTVYRQKNGELLSRGVNLVEIDLIRAGSHVLAVPEQKIPVRLTAQPMICVRRSTRLRAQLYAASLRSPLPNIGIPLRADDEDVVLQLQPIFNDIYRNGRYDSIDYRRPPNPRLSAEDETWAAGLLRQSGRVSG